MTESEALAVAIQLIGRHSNNRDAAVILNRMKNKLDKPRITIASAKAKGRSLPTKARQDLIEALGIDPGDIKVTPGGCAGIDLYLSPEARKKFPYGTECKNVEKLNFWSSWDQAATNAEKEGLKPMLLVKKNGLPILCVTVWDKDTIRRLSD